ncbi:MAG: hypothetical protein HY541_07690, partial [Deltaproteobacteria bacterium]|nr:hypothetical protein [Deltaproteobacteria bacterium]
MKKNKIILLFLLALLTRLTPLGAGEPKKETVPTETKKGNPLFRYFKDREIDVFPVPVWESRPDEGNTYGLMPVVLMSDHDKQIKAIFAAIGQYNTITGVSGAALSYYYPK